MRKRIYALILGLLLLCCLPVTVSAAKSVDLNAKGSITVRTVYKKNPLTGMKLNCIQVGEVVPSGTLYYFKSLYHDAIYTSENLHDSKNPGEMLELVKKGTATPTTVAADKDGKIKFDNLKPGLYLIYQTEVFTKGSNRFLVHEFFVTVPYQGKYDVDVTSKPGLDLYPDPPPTTPPGGGTPPGGKLPQTGQLSWPVPVMAIGGIGFFMLGWWLCFGRRKDSYEN